jgi:formylglycine-generating enzyme required for sulfatase activity
MMMLKRSNRFRLPVAAFLLFTTMASASSAEVIMDWVRIKDPGNACDPSISGCFGDVDYIYRISRLEVTNDQYAEFLNLVASTDTNDLYSTKMESGVGGVTRSGAPGTYSYSPIAGRENMPVNFVTFWSTLRFANWMNNGQPTGAQDNSTTEDGAYTLTPTGISENTVTRNPGASIVLTSQNEWYKAAYYDMGAMIYYNFPAGFDAVTTCSAAGAAANSANCDNAVGDLTAVGSYTGSASPGGTFDQGGNVFEWNETINGGTARSVRGGAYSFGSNYLDVVSQFGFNPANQYNIVGFRVASPNPILPPVPALGPVGIALLLSLLGATAYWRLRSGAAPAV